MQPQPTSMHHHHSICAASSMGSSAAVAAGDIFSQAASRLGAASSNSGSSAADSFMLQQASQWSNYRSLINPAAVLQVIPLIFWAYYIEFPFHSLLPVSSIRRWLPPPIINLAQGRPRVSHPFMAKPLVKAIRRQMDPQNVRPNNRIRHPRQPTFSVRMTNFWGIYVRILTKTMNI